MKILFLNTNIGYGGASKMLVWVANQCAQEGYDVTFVTYRDSVIHQELNSKVNHVHFELESDNGLGKGIISSILFFRKYIKQQKFDIAVGFLPPSQIRLSLSCIGLKTKLIFSQRGDPYQRKSSLIMKLAESFGNWLFSFADYFVFQTKGAQSFYPKKIQNRSIVIPNPINPLRRTQERDGHIEKKIVCVARLDLYQKRQDVLIEAFNLIKSDFPDYILELYGDGAKEDEIKLRKLAENNSQIIFKGSVSNIVASIQNASLAVLSSDFEGIPNALLEYMSLGIPSVSTDCSPGGAAMIIENGVNGMLVPASKPYELASAMKYMLSHPIEAEKMGKAGIHVLTRFAEDKIRRKWFDVFGRCLSL